MIDIESDGKSPALVALCGRSFSGKSTLANELARALSADLVSLDAINEERGLRGGEGLAVSEWAHTNDIAHARTSAILRAGRSVVVDDTNSLRFLRDRWRDLAAAENAQFALVYVHATEDVIRQRLAANRRLLDRHDVADTVMEEHLEQFEEPGDDEGVIVLDAEGRPAGIEVLRMIESSWKSGGQP